MNAKTQAPTLGIQRSDERYFADHGWLKTRHSFSFADYYDPANLNWGALRVFNDDVVDPGQGFPPHPHRDMEIITYVLAGQLEHKDSMGNHGIVGPGCVQYMSAGTGVRHSEYNHSPGEALHLIQMWVQPARIGTKPRYGQRELTAAERSERWLLYAIGQPGLVAPIDTGTLAGGTAIGTGLATGINVLRDSAAKSKVVILLTDGENNSGEITPLDAATMAKLLDVRVYTIGAVTLTATADKDVSSDSVDAQLMRKIAEDTGGHYYSVSDENSLAEVYREIESLEKSHVGARDFMDYQEAYLGFLSLGVAILFAELALAATVFRRTP